ncbi:MAG: DGQHR domain-containing protein [Saprospiraceae bacterium]|nr:DGQHR domain-containing protein [Candidatus Vicinibacter affinis]MBK6824694.1 DGQHR domain-containing protein [Candidatus Vicinibacter affinis]MBK7798567.1 DGQHR domain-containing protein [Candidatus Vicinibacter affinis]
MDNNSLIQLPAIKGIIGNWVYYQTVIPFKELITRIDNDHSIREYFSLDDHLQRDLSKRSKKIAEYLLREKTRFFNSAIIGLFGGPPNWYNFDFAPSAIPSMALPDGLLDTIGILELTGTEKLFSIDGQHRIDGIKQAMKKDPSMFKFDELPVIIIAHTDDKNGKIRTRKLFSEINTKAVRVSGLDDLITNEENPVDINARRFYAEFDSFKQDTFIQLSAASNISPDAKEFTTILNLKEVNKTLYARFYKHLDFRPSYEVIESLYQKSVVFWTAAINEIPKYKSIFVDATNSVNDYRSNDGGSMLFRPIGIRLLSEGYTEWLTEKGNTEGFWGKFSAIDDDLNSEYWKDVIWDNATKKIKAKTSHKFLVEYIKYLLCLEADLEYLKEEYNKLSGIEESNLNKIELPERP